MYILNSENKNSSMKKWQKPEISTILKKELEEHIKVSANSSSSCWAGYAR